MLSFALPSLNSLTRQIASSVLRFQSLMVHSISCIHDLKTRRAPDDVPPPLNFWIFDSWLCLNSDTRVCIVFCNIDSVMVSSFCTLGGVTFKLMLLTSGLKGMLAKCTCLALQSVPRVQSPNVSSVGTAPPFFYLLLEDNSYLPLLVVLLDIHLC